MGSANTRSVQYYAQFDMAASHSSSEPPAVVAMEVTADGGLLVCDKSSMKVILFDDYYRTVSEVRLTSEPYGMIHLSTGQILVSLPDLQCLQSLKVNKRSKLLLKGRIQTEVKCDRLIHYETNLIVSAHDDKSITFNIMNTDGQVLRCVRNEPIFPEGMFNRLGFIALSPDNCVLYVTEMCNGCIGLSVTTGEVLFVYRESKTKFLFGVCTDSAGYVYLTCTDMDRIVMINNKGKKVKQLATLKDTSPGYMTYSKRHKKLFIKTVYTNKILVYDVT